MALVKTDLGNTKESAKRLRFEPFGSISATNVQDAIEEAASSPPVVTETAVNFAASPYTVPVTATFLAVDTSGGPITINLGAASARAGVPLTIKDVTGNAAANNITINRAGADTIEGLTAISVNVDFGGFHLTPRTGGYVVTP